MFDNLFKLKQEVSETTDDANDVLNTKTKLKDFGYYKEPDYGMTKITDKPMFEGIRNLGEEVSNMENTFRERYYKQLKK